MADAFVSTALVVEDADDTRELRDVDALDAKEEVTVATAVTTLWEHFIVGESTVGRTAMRC